MQAWKLSSAALLCAAGSAFAAPPVQLVFWTAGDCVYCSIWKNGERAAEFVAEAQRLGVGLAVMAKPTLKSPDTSFKWTASASMPGEAAPALDTPRGLPAFDVLCNGKSLARLTGLGDWDSFWRSELRRAARSCAGPSG